MKLIEEVNANHILEHARSMVQNATKEILATMDLRAEVEKPLPQSYFILLLSRVLAGVTVTRLGFGEKKDFLILLKKLGYSHVNYNFIFANNLSYKRLLLVDNHKLIFAVDKNGSDRFFYTTNKQILQKYRAYFFKTLELSRPHACLDLKLHSC